MTSKAAVKATLRSDQWACTACTFHNSTQDSSCEACGTRSPPAPVVVKYTKGDLPAWGVCAKPTCNRRVYTSDYCRDHSAHVPLDDVKAWLCQRCAVSSARWQHSDHCESCRLSQECIQIRFDTDYFGGAHTATNIDGTYCGNPRAAAIQLLDPSSETPFFACIERHEIMGAILEQTALDAHLIAPLIKLIVKYVCEPGSFKVGNKIDVAIPEEEFNTQGNNDAYRWKAGVISSIHGTQVSVFVGKDDYFSHRTGWVWQDWIDIFEDEEWDRLAPLGTYKHHHWYDFYQYPCWQGDTRVLLANGAYMAIDQLRAGDMVMSPVIDETDDQSSSSLPSRMIPQRIERVVHSRINRQLPMVNVNGMWITRGHPMYIPRINQIVATKSCDDHNTVDNTCSDDMKSSTSSLSSSSSSLSSSTSSSSTSSSSVSIGGTGKYRYDWWRPDECYEQQMHFIDTIYNLQLDNCHTVICSPPLQTQPFATSTTSSSLSSDTSGGIICCTLGRHCGDRLRRARPDQAEAFGRGLRLRK